MSLHRALSSLVEHVGQNTQTCSRIGEISSIDFACCSEGMDKEAAIAVRKK
jgi:hypothetical protein